MGSLEGRKALVTGGSRGIGRAICLRLAAEGADVAVNYNGSEAAARETADEVAKLGRKSWVYQADVGSVAPHLDGKTCFSDEIAGQLKDLVSGFKATGAY